METTKQIYRRPGATVSTAVDCVKIGNLVFLAGQTHNGGLITSPLVEQAEGVYKKISGLLAQLNGSMTDIVDETVYVTKMDEYMNNWEKFDAIRKSAYGQQASSVFSILEVKSFLFSGLFSSGHKIMIKCTAYIDGNSITSEIPTLTLEEQAKKKLEQQKNELRQKVIALRGATEESVDAEIYEMPLNEFKKLTADLGSISRVDFGPQ